MTFTAHSLAASAPAAIPAPVWSGFDIGPLRIHAYALCILLGIIAAIWLTSIRWKRRGGPEGSIWDIAIWAIPFGIIGGRLYHVFSSPDAYFGPGYNGTGNLWLIPQIWRGGLGIWGAVVLGVIGAWIGCRRAGVKISAFIDAAAPGILLAQAIGRWGNYFNQELFGGPTTLPWGLHVDPQFVPSGFSPDTLFHPTFLYECVWDVLGVVALLLIDRHFRMRRGRLFLMYAMIYTAGRLWIEMLRIDAAEHLTFFGITARLNVWTSILVFTAALLVFLILTFVRRKSVAQSVYLPGREPAAVGAGTAGTDQAGGTTGTDDAGASAAQPAGAASSDAGARDAGDREAGARHVAPKATDLKATDSDAPGSGATDVGGPEARGGGPGAVGGGGSDEAPSGGASTTDASKKSGG
ncbi:prolipoprotein diacylglyceryl transferase [Arthrobacter dokdonensis]|uniref:prolipoprotein diacylglyceryl transferase n=1 Tax=Arthrobacter dokdonellae TaxID=2211210 RepID=UPI001494263E|nr:prolipoprotein diacylglyceryl transferase [Arthrobacter dokdonellae]